MKKKIFISDILGKKSGMHYYHEAEILSLRDKYSYCEIKSNYNSVFGKSYYPNIFSGSLFFRLLKLISVYFKFLKLCLGPKTTEVRHYWYGTWVDIPFILIALPFKHVIFDIHEIVMLDYRGRSLLRLIKFFFGFSRNKFIVHNENSYKALSKVIDSNRISIIPHPALSPSPKYNLDNIPDKLVNFINLMKARRITIFLFFGDLRPSKGIHEILKLCADNNDVSFLICGQDIFGIEPRKLISCEKVFISPKRQSDEELAYLFSNSDIILLPYKNSSQSGVLEVARSFEKPVVFSHHLSLISRNYEFPKLICNFDDDIDTVRIALTDFGNYIKGIIKN